jgi:BTB/POZ domain
MDYELPAAIMIGLKPARLDASSRPSSPDGWLWRKFSRHLFAHENDFFECHGLPSLSELLQVPAVAKQDAIALTVQIVTGPGWHHAVADDEQHMPSTILFPQPNVHCIPKSILHSLESLLDCARTGDVRIIVRERGLWIPPFTDSVEEMNESNSGTAIEDGNVRPYPIGTCFPADVSDNAEVVVRDRVIWAHSGVLRARSHYFANMLDSGFSEGQELADPASASQQLRRFATLRIPDADFATAYWLLRYLYVGELHFADEEDVKEASMEENWGRESGQPQATSAFVLNWIRPDDLAAGALPLSNQANQYHNFEAGNTHAQLSRPTEPTHQRQLSGRGSAGSLSSNASGNQLVQDGAPPVSPTRIGPTYAISRQARFPTSTSPHLRAGSVGRTFSADQHRQQQQLSQPCPPPQHANEPSTTPWLNILGDEGSLFDDQHAHPCSKAPPASALAMYKLAHRYGQNSLAQLATRHLIGSLTPGNAFSILLATSLYPDVHAGVRDYVCE